MINAAIILAGGASQRMHGYGKKELIELNNGKSIIYNATINFLNSDLFQYIVLVYNKDHKLLLKEAMQEFSSKIEFVEGGKTRQDSVWFGLKKLQTITPIIDKVLIHDGARPWISSSLIKNILDTLLIYPAVVPTLTIRDSIKEIDKDGMIVSHLDRDKIVLSQTPQGFDFKQIYQAHSIAQERKLDKEITDDVQLLSLISNISAKSIAGDNRNIKVTYNYDLEKQHG